MPRNLASIQDQVHDRWYHSNGFNPRYRWLGDSSMAIEEDIIATSVEEQYTGQTSGHGKQRSQAK